MKIHIGLSFLVFFGVATISEPLAWAQDRAIIRVAGSTTVLPILSRAAERFQATHPDIKITVNAGGSGVGIQSVGMGRVDIGMASREMTDKEHQRYRAARLQTVVIGRDAVACVISSEVYQAGVHSLTRQQIRDIYLGKITNWKRVGGPDRTIIVIDKEPHRGTRHVFMQYLFGRSNARAPGARLITGSNNEEQAKVAQSDSAIGMLSLAWLNDDVVAVGIRERARDTLPTLANVRAGRFPIARNLNLIISGAPAGPLKQFLDFLLGPEGQTIVEKSGYLSITSPQAVSKVADSPRP
ncbi:MAG: extracellular solute-binding protein [Nitrospinaceae bacterium]|nr:phosphate ABC transporter substrate-binding protein [Nitrospinaceae bacterium]NIR55647.1 phosphate ABC transporter substrate-binding protein [Nitrospinaceae bacterium]NIS86089.1 phosphate ABC transporter substrate-binding protein [Nitrospinaceae bacterium]NIT82933.1 phosphate ABC transporter substrate-binding protein [Nitrospinaceae bacterium]NIU45136.1 phosphate ABC transporter substrate-binding protein [Nitrospinaceae bacterium]